MRKILLGCLLLVSLISVAAFAEDMTGLITCSKCRHTTMKEMNCAQTCIKGGVPAIFYQPSTQKFYNIANQDAVKEHFGQRVVVTGTVSGDTLTVESVKPAPSRKKKS